MDNELEYRSIEGLLKLLRNKMLTANPEYQRGEVWSESQKKKLIDSVLRGYPLPVIYLHHIQRDVDGMRRDDLEIIDGQQRINAIHAFREGAFQLFDPIVDESQARFPIFLKEQPCPWGRKAFESLSEELQTQFLGTELPVAIITSESTHEVRDLFVRLQSGLPLNPQEKRDAQPGDFNHFVLKLGGKAQLPQYPALCVQRGSLFGDSPSDSGQHHLGIMARPNSAESQSQLGLRKASPSVNGGAR